MKDRTEKQKAAKDSSPSTKDTGKLRGHQQEEEDKKENK